MEKQKKQFIIVIAALVVLVLIYVGIRFYNSRQEEKEAEEEAAATITLTDFDTDDVTAFSYQLDGTTLSFTKDGDNWTYDGDASLDIDEDAVETMLSSVCALTADEELTEYDSLADYGLDTPQDTITITTADASITLLAGNANDITGDYYVMLDGDDTVYLISTSLTSTFSSTAEELIAEEDTETEEPAEAVTDTTEETDAAEEAEVTEAE